MPQAQCYQLAGNRPITIGSDFSMCVFIHGNHNPLKLQSLSGEKEIGWE